MRQLADNERPTSLASRMRARRFELFETHLARVPRPCRILDAGGSDGFWRRMGWHAVPEGIELVILNLDEQPATLNGARKVRGDARDLSQFGDGAFDVVFSNSVIEHVGSFDDQRRFADEVRRVGRRLFIQTPARGFPVEPHFLVPGFQFLPRGVRARMVQRRALGWMPQATSRAEALEIVDSVQLLGAREMRRLFPETRLYRERVGPLTKSYVAICGFTD